ncbi:zonular occludens toxin family protein [Vreelandella utahensis]|uniref:zonular occludens toxin family protein n=1 Tax=Vreelandella halophila TaxID=86177 RepID=UPI000986ABED|nr:zonular occludens toxin domain-containing protein [Halomonas utahensis]
MIIFHEGLPGAGKTYEAMVYQVLPAIEKGRKVYAYINGIDHKKIAGVLDESEERVRSLLIPLSEDQVPEVHKHVENDSLVVLDELQNFFPAGRQKLSDGVTQFVTEHRHRGLDILGIGQDIRDCHNLWKRRVSQKVVFTKLDAVGAASRYNWTVYKAKAGEKFEKIRSGRRKYDPKYFGIYASHTQDTENTDDFKDDRANILKTPGFKYGLPAAVLVGFMAVNYLVSFLNDPGFVEKEQTETEQQQAGNKTQSQEVVTVSRESDQSNSERRDGVNVPRKDKEPEPLDYFDRMADKYRLRLSGVVESDDKLVGRVQALDGSYRVQEQFRLTAIEALGWSVERTGYGLKVEKTDDQRTVSHVVRPWPVEPFGSVPDSTSANL